MIYPFLWKLIQPYYLLNYQVPKSFLELTGCSKDDKEAVIEGIFIGEVKAIEDCTNQFKFS